ncbi:60S ribosomal protein L34 [Salpingoeca rosetta]|uniref:Large ribosomal subunit protein eL34 n=1 Tax=Salpingoeca rosetta (strain ATCC 50818 / BSB-021) TaxID=946362 RepID=F2U5J1_SALR5|nr:60S ribosomal protein L34 [Salpingoeca rosetta]EGD83207.1 60S ribosomal protein L34 [Salpingoeca rosetta]|eukprot:XP_004995571.1 60S ribosomal protein L34 [Salpingoeca rosetta]
MVQRLTYRRRHSYNTKSNRTRVVKTPGGRLVFQYRKKQGSIPKCGDCHSTLSGIRAMRPYQMSRATKQQKTVQRAYGGSRCHQCVRNRIVRAFLIEEQKIVKQVLKSQAQSKAAKKEKKEVKKAKQQKKTTKKTK